MVLGKVGVTYTRTKFNPFISPWAEIKSKCIIDLYLSVNSRTVGGDCRENPSRSKQCLMVHDLSPSTQKAEAGRSFCVPGQPEVHRDHFQPLHKKLNGKQHNKWVPKIKTVWKDGLQTAIHTWKKSVLGFVPLWRDTKTTATLRKTSNWAGLYCLKFTPLLSRWES